MLALILCLFGVQPEDWAATIRLVASQGRGTQEGRAAWDKLVAGDAKLLVPILKAMDSSNTPAANWLRTAFDRIVQKSGRTIDVQALIEFATNTTHAGRARRIALETAERLLPGTSARLYRDWLDDPEFRFEAVGLILEEAKNAAKKKSDAATTLFERALSASRDLAQARQAAAGLKALGVEVSVAQHFGFLVDWYVIGPFDGGGMKGFSTSYPPEQKVDLKSAYDGPNGKIHWKRVRIKETPAAKHQALLVLNHKDVLGDADDAVAFAYTEFTLAKAEEVEFRGAADDNFTVWVNGRKVFAFEEWRNGVHLDRHRFRVPLNAGKNTVLVKICQTNPEPNWEFFLRLADNTGKGIPFQNALP